MIAGLGACAVVLAAATVAGLAWRRRRGRLRPAGPARVTETQLGQPLGARATLVQFSTAFCAPCRATRRVLAEVAGMIEGVAHVEIDAEAHLDLVRQLGIYRTPTVLVLGPEGFVTRRASGQPRKADVIAALGEAVPGYPRTPDDGGRDASLR
jgi:thiol-disulfide isomerase/thioredoxin